MKKNDNLRTPDWVIKELGNIDLDPCAGEFTAIADVNWSICRGEDGLKRDWFGFVYCNPPFSQKELWIEKMVQYKYGILLLPERGSAPWSAPLSNSCKYRWTMGRKINFEGGNSSNNCGSVLFLFGDEAIDRVISSSLPGTLDKTLLYHPRD